MSEEIMKRLAEQADINTKVLAQLEAARNDSIEKGKKLDEALKQLEGLGKRTARRSLYLDALRSKDGDGGTIEERVERAISEVEVEHTIVNGKRVPLIRSMPRGLNGVEDMSGLVFMRMARMMALAKIKGDGTDVLDVAKRTLGATDPATLALEEQREMLKQAEKDPEGFGKRALGTQVLGAGAGFVAPQYTVTFQDYVFAQAILKSLGAMTLPLIGNGGEVILFLDTAMTVGFREEGGGQNESSPTEGTQNVLRRILSGTLAVNNEWLEESSYSVDAVLRTHMAAAMMEFFDKKCMLGRGNSNEVRGLDYWVEQPTTAHYFNRSLDTGAITCQTVMADFANAIGKVTSVERHTLQRPYAIMNDKEARGLAIMKEGTGAITRPFREEILGGTIFGLRLGVTTQLPSTLAGDAAGSGTNNKTKIFVGDASAMAIYERGGIDIEAFRGGTYKDNTGTLVSGLTNRQTVLTADMYFDFVEMWRGKKTARIDSVDYSAAAGVTA